MTVNARSRGVTRGTGPRARASRWIDVSVALRPGMPAWPGDPAFETGRLFDLERGDEATVSWVRLGAHAGTHMDAPLHFLRDGAALDTVPDDAIVGRARVIEIHDPESVKPAELAAHRIRRGERILFKTRNSSRCWDAPGFVADFVSISHAAAALLAATGVRTVGIDYLSVGALAGDGAETHRVLLAAGIWIVEGLDLRAVGPGRVDLVCLPLKIEGAEGAPARVLVRPRPAPGRSVRR